MWLLVPMLASWSISATVGLVVAIRTHDRIYRYASRQAARYDVMDPAGRAYSDMATVIVLDGKCDDRSLIEVA